jgi:5-methylcytosine-specific restriction endonuclease McrA
MLTTNCLVLTPWMQPHQSIEWQEAVTLVFLGKVEALEHYDAVVSSPSVTVHIPAVARLKKHVSRTKRDVKFSRMNVYTRDGFRCQFCGEKKAQRLLTYDHVVPFSRGGKTEWTNIVTACGGCNRRKANRTPEEAGMRLLKRPVRPKALPLAGVFALPSVVPVQWLPYLEESALAADA